ncbi:MarR family winged helix-turn-helix transcriptional regulator [Paracoccus laeviglucosivorans]|uniref:HTH-type transcriptional regulator SarZ n=1 Tax=Paracoccus laeviglucosivorans TaxID=1197861 RepID=A0A521DX87_9RHOB|nr:MarR family transcriptional regulator [Paracoccus laeviglucosivorans]SMO76232.1 transcriptional regulator, MarR family [Paracoccus laeviglucosivorans]
MKHDISKPEPDTARGLDTQLCFATYAAGLAFNRVYRHQLEPLGLTFPQYITMVSLWTKDGVTTGTLGEEVALETNTLTPMLKRMEAMGLLERRRDTADERRVLVYLTKAGRSLQPKADEIMRCVAEAAGFPMEELMRLTTQMQRLRQNLMDYADRNAPCGP